MDQKLFGGGSGLRACLRCFPDLHPEPVVEGIDVINFLRILRLQQRQPGMRIWKALSEAVAVCHPQNLIGCIVGGHYSVLTI